MTYLLPFESIRKDDTAKAGGKGANLGELVSLGVPVPEGAVLLSSAYDLFMRENGIDEKALLRSAASDRDASAKLREQILGGRLPEPVERELRAFFQSLGPGARVAVRSSATAEDLEDFSFAGQQETYLNVTSEEKLLQKVRECYASLWGERAIRYRAENGYGDQPVSLAVVIQRMVESDSAGVLFTRTPENGEDLLINASYGLGEAVVSGLVTPDEYVFGRDGAAKSVRTGSKEMMIVYGESGTRKVPVPEKMRGRRVLDDDALSALAALAVRIESHYGRAMDIEWAVKDGKVYVLQARPVTAFGAEKPSFSEADFAGLPKAKPAKGRLRESVLFNLEKLPTPYLPLDYSFGGIIGRQKQRLFAEAGIRMNEANPIDENGISSFAIEGFGVSKEIVRLPGLLKQMKDTAFNTKKSSEELAACREALRQEREQACGSAQDAGRSLERLLALVERTAYARFCYAIFPQVLENLYLKRVLKKLDPALNPFDLMEGLSYVTADLNREMAELAAFVRTSPEMREAVMTLSIPEILERFPELSLRFAAFMERFGDRQDNDCYCFAARNWNEDPDRFLHSLRTMLRSRAQVPSREEGERKFSALMDKAGKVLSEKEMARFVEKTEGVRHDHMIREATQYLWESEFALCRKRLKEAAGYLGISYHDLQYLFAPELFALCREGKASDAVREKINARKEKRPLAESYWEKSIRTMLETDGSGLTGVSGSGGRATGRACIVRGPEEFGKLSEGDILVCPHTDPEWTPLFTLAAGVVVDTGGTLSHAAIVAREYGIPAVLATGNATSVIRDGDKVLVDGTAGTVVLQTERQR